MNYRTGLNYYNTKNDITKRKKYIYTEGGLLEDPYVANNKISSSFYPLLIDQKVDYLIGEKPLLPIDDDKFYQELSDCAKLASAQGVQWAYPYLKNGELRLELIPTCELEWTISTTGELMEMRRTVVENDKTYVYVYDKEGIKKYKDSVGGHPIEITGHYSVSETIGANEETKHKSWGVVPFLPMWNNKTGLYDLQPIKPYIDQYDKVISDFANNLEDFQDVTWILKGYAGQDPGEFIKDVKMYKSIPLSEDGDARPETIEIPTTARQVALEILEDKIYAFGRGVNMSKLAGGSLTNVVIKAQFSNLDMKCKTFAYQVDEFIRAYVEFYNLYAIAFNKPLINTDFEIVYNKSNIINEVELLAANTGQMMAVSDELRLANHPWVNTQEELEEEIIRSGAGARIDEPEEDVDDGQEEPGADQEK